MPVMYSGKLALFHSKWPGWNQQRDEDQLGEEAQEPLGCRCKEGPGEAPWGVLYWVSWKGSKRKNVARFPGPPGAKGSIIPSHAVLLFWKVHFPWAPASSCVFAFFSVSLEGSSFPFSSFDGILFFFPLFCPFSIIRFPWVILSTPVDVIIGHLCENL